MKMNIMFDEQQAMTMALNISGNHVMCLDLKENRVYDLHGKALFGNNVGIEVCYNYVHPDDCEKFRSFIRRLSDGTLPLELQLYGTGRARLARYVFARHS